MLKSFEGGTGCLCQQSWSEWDREIMGTVTSFVSCLLIFTSLPPWFVLSFHFVYVLLLLEATQHLLPLTFNVFLVCSQSFIIPLLCTL